MDNPFCKVVTFWFLCLPFCFSENVKQNGSLENVIEIPISVYNMLVKNKNQISEQNLKNNFYTLPVVYTLSPVVEESKKSDKVLLTPLYFSYNKKPEDNIPEKVDNQSSAQPKTEEKKSNTVKIPTNHKINYPYNTNYDYYDLYYDHKNEPYFLPSNSNEGSVSEKRNITPENNHQSQSYVKFIDIDNKNPEKIVAKYDYSTDHSGVENTGSRPAVEKKSKVKIEKKSKSVDKIKRKYQNQNSKPKVVPKNDLKRSKYQKITSKKTTVTRKHETGKIPKGSSSNLKKNLTKKFPKCLEEKYFGERIKESPKDLSKSVQAHPKIAERSSEELNTTLEPSEKEDPSEHPNRYFHKRKQGTAKDLLKKSSTQSKIKSSSEQSKYRPQLTKKAKQFSVQGKEVSHSPELESGEELSEESSNVRITPERIAKQTKINRKILESNSQKSFKQKLESKEEVPENNGSNLQETEEPNLNLETSSSEEPSQENEGLPTEKYKIEFTSKKNKPNEKERRHFEVVYKPIVDQDEESTTVVYKNSQTSPVPVKNKTNSAEEEEEEEKEEELVETSKDASSEHITKEDPSPEVNLEYVKKQKIPIAKFKFELETLKPVEKVQESSAEHDSGENFRKISKAENLDTNFGNVRESSVLKKSYRDPEKEYNEHYLPIKYHLKKTKPQKKEETFVPKTDLDYDIFEEIFPERYRNKNDGQKLEETKRSNTGSDFEPHESKNKEVLKKKPKRKNKKKLQKIEERDRAEILRENNRNRNYEVTEPDYDLVQKHEAKLEGQAASSRRIENKAPVDDIAPASSDNTPEQTKAHQQDSVTSEQKHAPEHKNSKHKQGGGKEHHSDHHGEEGNKKESGHKGEHKHHKKEIGHHDKNGKKGGYQDKGGHEKKSHKGDGYFGEHKEGAEGEKGSEFKENGEHKKGHSTKGEHNVHKKEEYSKTKHFFDESHEEGEHEKHGGYHEEHNKKKGGKEKYGHLNGAYKDHHYGKKGKHAKGDKYHEDKGHKDAKGHNTHYKHYDKYGKKDDHDGYKKWLHKKKG